MLVDTFYTIFLSLHVFHNVNMLSLLVLVQRLLTKCSLKKKQFQSKCLLGVVDEDIESP